MKTFPTVYLAKLASHVLAISCIFGQAGIALAAPQSSVEIVPRQLQNGEEIEVLTIDATPQDDVVVVKVAQNGQIKVTLNGEATRWNPMDFQRIRFLGRSGDDEFTNLTDINCAAFGHNGNDILRGGNGHNWIQGGNGDDEIYGGDKNDQLRGRAGDDFIDGGKRHDRIFGGPGNDLIVGGAGHDFIKGEEGDDTVFGGNGDDRVFAGEGSDEIEMGKSLGEDTVFYDGNESDYMVDFDDPSLMVASLGLMDLITEVDCIQFADVKKTTDDYALQLTDVEEGIFTRLNQLRESRGLQPLKIRTDLTEFSRHWLEVCFKTRRGDLTDDSHSEFEDHGFLFVGDRNGNGENLAFSTFRNLDSEELAELAHDTWLNSRIHRGNMLFPDFDEVGIAAYRENNTWYFMQFFMSNR